MPRSAANTEPGPVVRSPLGPVLRLVQEVDGETRRFGEMVRRRQPDDRQRRAPVASLVPKWTCAITPATVEVFCDPRSGPAPDPSLPSLTASGHPGDSH